MRRPLVLGVLLWLCLPMGAHVAAQTDYAGTYKAGASEARAEVTTWGKDCGPRPQNNTEPARGSVVVSNKGTHLSLALPDRTLRTDACWSPNPNVRLTNATASGNRWRAECRTAEGDAKRERGVYTITASSPEVLELVEDSDYDWQLNESHCVAKVRVTQRLARGASANKPAPAPAPTPEPEPAPAPSCVPGPLAKLRLRPSEAQIAPGQRICFTARGLDAAGCALPVDAVALRWDLSKPAGVTGTLSGGCFKAAANAAEAEGRFKVTVSSGPLRAEVPVNVTTADLSDITARRSGTASELSVSEGDDGAASSGIQAAVERSSTSVKLALAALLLGCVAGLAWFVSSKLRRHAAAPDDDDERTAGSSLSSSRAHEPGSAREARVPGASSSGRPASPSDRPSASSGASEQLICPQCRRGYPGGTERCPKDGAAPIPYAEFVRQAQAAQPVARTCTSCGAQLAAGAQFCGECGAKVRP